MTSLIDSLLAELSERQQRCSNAAAVGKPCPIAIIESENIWSKVIFKIRACFKVLLALVLADVVVSVVQLTALQKIAQGEDALWLCVVTYVAHLTLLVVFCFVAKMFLSSRHAPPTQKPGISRYDAAARV